MDILAVAAPIAGAAPLVSNAASSGLTINLFWVIVAAVNFIIFTLVIWRLFFKPVSATLEARRERIEEGLRDADAARRDRETAAEQRQAVILKARSEAADVVAHSQRVAEEVRQRSVDETRSEIDAMRAQAVADIDAERQRALTDVRAEVAQLALLAASKVVGETMTGQRERRLVDEFLAEIAPQSPTGGERN